MTRINADIFVNAGEKDFTKIYVENNKVKKEILKELFDNELVEHEGTRSYQLNATFEKFYSDSQGFFKLVDLNKDGIYELIFEGLISKSEEKEFTEIYVKTNNKYSLKYIQVGTLIAYKINPNTQEIVLFQHQYPCCSAMSHNIYTLRFIENNFKITSKYFLGRDTDMKGILFPEKVDFNSKYSKLSKETMVYWSCQKIKSNASLMSQTNEIIHYKKNALYRVIARKGRWKYVIFYGAPKIEKSKVVRAENLTEMHFFVWIKD